MGLYSDIVEDAQDTYGEFVSRRVAPTSPARHYRPMPLVQCPHCWARFESEVDLQTHLFNSHSRDGHYLRVNGQIARELVYLQGPVKELAVLATIQGSVVVRLHLPKLAPQKCRINATNECNLLEHFPILTDSRMALPERLDLVIGREGDDNWYQYTIYCQPQASLDTRRADSVIRALQSALDQGVPQEWDSLLETLHRDFSSGEERRYIDGFFEYSYGSYLDLRGHPLAGSHLENSFTRLKPFDSGLAHTARSIVSLRLNWFDYLRGSDPHSRFWAPGWFFNEFDPRKSLWPDPSDLLHLSFETSSSGVWIDDCQLLVIEACIHFALRAYDDLQAALRSLENYLATRQAVNGIDLNNQEKLTLLRAREAFSLGNAARALRSYRLLQNHPRFGAEARWAIKETK